MYVQAKLTHAVKADPSFGGAFWFVKRASTLLSAMSCSEEQRREEDMSRRTNPRRVDMDVRESFCEPAQQNFT